MKFLSLFWVLASLLPLVACHNVLLHPRGKTCFFETMKVNDVLAVTFQVGNRDPSHQDQLTADFNIIKPNGQSVKQLYDVSHGDVSLEVDVKGKYEYCFSNERWGIATKDITFNIHGVVYVDLNDVDVGDTLDKEVRNLAHLVQEVRDEQTYIVIRERTHRNTAESTNDRVKWWSIFQIIVVAANSLFQIYYLKRFFEVKSVI